MIRSGDLAQPPAPEPYYRRRLAELKAKAEPARTAMQVLNSRYHYARAVHRGPFDLFWHPVTGVFYLRVSVGRRVLPVPDGSEHVGRYDRASTWEEVKADYLAVRGGKA